MANLNFANDTSVAERLVKSTSPTEITKSKIREIDSTAIKKIDCNETGGLDCYLAIGPLRPAFNSFWRKHYFIFIIFVWDIWVIFLP